MLRWASNDPNLTETEAVRLRGRRIALLILAVCAAPTVAAWLAYFVWQPTARLNYGELVDARPLPDSEMRALDGSTFRITQLRGKWLLLQFDSGACEEGCRRKLLYMRQARLAQGRGAERIERVWILSDSTLPDPRLLRDYPGVHVARVSDGTPLADFTALRNPAEHIYVVDPLGNLMLKFPGDPDTRRMTRDLSRLLRASRIG